MIAMLAIHLHPRLYSASHHDHDDPEYPSVLHYLHLVNEETHE